MRAGLAQRLTPLLIVGGCSFPDYGLVLDAPVCNDGLQGPKETGVDCGGPCPACKAGGGCNTNADCESGHCEENVCRAPTCIDKVANGAESDVDCGGSCMACSPGARCSSEANCSTGVCQAGTCRAASCSDRVQNGSETGTDCGGPCSACRSGAGCSVNSDCTSQSCQKIQLICVDPDCLDQIKNGTESDVDCGGDKCAPCTAKRICNGNADCDSTSCDSKSKRCVAASCLDSLLNQDETDVDCGGAVCARCATNHACLGPSDCETAVCQAKLCVPTKATNVPIPPTAWIPSASSSSSSDTLPGKIIDGDASTRWTSGMPQAPGMWFMIDLSKVEVFFSLTIDSQHDAGDAAQQFRVYFSTDGRFTSAPRGPYESAAVSSVVSDSPIVARYIKLELTAGSSKWWSIDELRVSQ